MLFSTYSTVYLNLPSTQEPLGHRGEDHIQPRLPPCLDIGDLDQCAFCKATGDARDCCPAAAALNRTYRLAVLGIVNQIKRPTLDGQFVRRAVASPTAAFGLIIADQSRPTLFEGRLLSLAV